ncbi:GNAT family N-acetyltransferase [Kitasatospora brasiliensis]|uniref:GNAT family N-acetyltransferase n=1 Tax=Kitasatospora brasiliensis TaxID=3058040 RepID=UPI002930BA58|nr:GNAT family N-acetyltransferase [Kitasatospora sp. K002]
MGNSDHTAVDTVNGLLVRAVSADEMEEWSRALNFGFMRPDVGAAMELRHKLFEPGRMLAGFDGERQIATFRSFDTALTVPGGSFVRADAVTNVTVSATHRRRGLLSAMMRRDLAAAAERGCAVAILLAAEYNIYGRFGFGPATRGGGWKIDLRRTRGLRDGLPGVPGGRIDFVTMAELRELGSDLHERWRRTQPGAIERSAVWWERNTGEIPVPGEGFKEPFAAVHRDADGTVTGLVIYRVTSKWDHAYPDCTLTVDEFIALDLPTSVELWRLVLSVDWVARVEVPKLGPDDPLPLLLQDRRAATPHENNSDMMWLRLLDVEAAFAARTYGAPGRVVLEVDDKLGYASGRWALEAAEDGTGRCVRTADDADLALGASQLGSLYLGAETASRLASAALLTELRPGAAAAADLLLRTPAQAWTPTEF